MIEVVLKEHINLNFSIIILQYNNFNDTKKCVNSLLNFTKETLRIVIVDNGSQKFDKLKLNKFAENKKDTYIINSPINLGFSAGNNLGYKYAKKNLNSDFIILLNNDTTINQKNFFKEIDKLYRREKFAVCGPDIYNPLTGKHQSPFFKTNKITPMFMCKLIVKSIFDPVINIIKFNKKCPCLSKEMCRGVCTHGACWILSKEYFEKFPDGLNDKLFMYGEEILLSLNLEKKNLIQIYSPKLQINHFEGGSTTTNYQFSFSKYIFKTRNEVRSLNTIRKMLFKKEV